MISTVARKLLRDQIRSDDLAYDPWGTAIAHLFAICDVLSVVDADAIPARWEFRHGAFNDPTIEELADSDDHLASEYAADVLSGHLTTEDLVAWGNVLSRLTDVARKAGRSY